VCASLHHTVDVIVFALIETCFTHIFNVVLEGHQICLVHTDIKSCLRCWEFF